MSQLKELEKIAKEESFDSEIAASLQQLREQFKTVKMKERLKSAADIKYLLKRELAAKLQGTDAAYATSFERDETLKKAIEIIKDREQYNTILAISAEKRP